VATKAIFGRPVQTVVDIIHTQLTRTEKMAFHEKYHVLMNYSEDHKIVPVLHQNIGYNQKGREPVAILE